MPAPPVDRRWLLRALLGSPLAGVMACRRPGAHDARQPGSSRAAPRDPPQPLSFADSVAIVLAAIGPGRASDRAAARELITRFLTPSRRQRYLPREQAIRSLARRFGADAFALDEVDLRPLTGAEREALVALVVDLHASVAVRFHAVGEPPPGSCVGDPSWHTRAPHQG